jgi:hypothetical protein
MYLERILTQIPRMTEEELEALADEAILRYGKSDDKIERSEQLLIIMRAMEESLSRGRKTH